MYDIIGDIHGHAAELRELLHAMGYVERTGTFRHPERQAVFVGDFIDRGPHIREVLRLVQSMVAAGAAQAVMGNHEFNALAWQTKVHDELPGDHQTEKNWLRPHKAQNRAQHQATLDQLGATAADPKLAEALAWFRELPFALDLEGIRVVHACWDPQQIALLQAKRSEHGGVTSAFLREAMDHASELFRAIEDVLKGKEAPLPPGLTLPDNEGHHRSQFRTRWYLAPRGIRYCDFALPNQLGLPDSLIPAELHKHTAPYPDSDPPVFFGHYWLRADNAPPQPLARNVACVDYSVAKGGMLCAYRWDGETELKPEHFCSVASRA